MLGGIVDPHAASLLDRGIKRAQWSVLTGIKKPGILFEGGFVTNSKECLLIASESYQKTVAAAIADAVHRARQPVDHVDPHRLRADDQPHAMWRLARNVGLLAGGIGQLFSTHPPIEERIAALQNA